MSKGAQIAVGASMIALLLGWYATSNFEEIGSFRYFQTLAEFQAEGEPGAPARVHGYVAPGSIARDVEAKQVRFAVQNEPPHRAGAARWVLPVIYAGLDTPDLFKDAAEVIVEGRLDGRGEHAIFRADNVLAKCPSKFEAKRTEVAPFQTRPPAGSSADRPGEDA